jgi:hypothetical protein
MFSMQTYGVTLLRGMDNRGNPVAGSKKLSAECVELNGRTEFDLYGSNIHYSCLFSECREYSFKEMKYFYIHTECALLIAT